MIFQNVIISSANRVLFLPVHSVYFSFCPSVSYCTGKGLQKNLNSSCETGHPCLVLDLWRKAFGFLPWSMVLSVGFSQMFSTQWLRYFLPVFFLVCWDSLIMNTCWFFSNAFASPIDIIIWVFFILLIWWII